MMEKIRLHNNMTYDEYRNILIYIIKSDKEESDNISNLYNDYIKYYRLHKNETVFWELNEEIKKSKEALNRKDKYLNLLERTLEMWFLDLKTKFNKDLEECSETGNEAKTEVIMENMSKLLKLLVSSKLLIDGGDDNTVTICWTGEDSLIQFINRIRIAEGIDVNVAYPKWMKELKPIFEKASKQLAMIATLDDDFDWGEDGVNDIISKYNHNLLDLNDSSFMSDLLLKDINLEELLNIKLKDAADHLEEELTDGDKVLELWYHQYTLLLLLETANKPVGFRLYVLYSLLLSAFYALSEDLIDNSKLNKIKPFTVDLTDSITKLLDKIHDML